MMSRLRVSDTEALLLLRLRTTITRTLWKTESMLRGQAKRTSSYSLFPFINSEQKQVSSGNKNETLASVSLSRLKLFSLSQKKKKKTLVPSNDNDVLMGIRFSFHSLIMKTLLFGGGFEGGGG